MFDNDKISLPFTIKPTRAKPGTKEEGGTFIIEPEDTPKVKLNITEPVSDDVIYLTLETENVAEIIVTGLVDGSEIPLNTVRYYI